MIDAEAIREYKLARRAEGIKVNLDDLLALSKNHDPYYLLPRGERLAEWALEHWNRLGYTSGVHDRRMYYALLDQADSFDGRPFQNTKLFWNQLKIALLWARYLELIPEDSIVDHKNPHAQIFDGGLFGRPSWSISAHVSEPELYEGEEIQLPDFPAMPGLESHVTSDLRPYRLEVWAEKSTMNDILVPLCESLGVNLQTFTGDGSYTRSHEFTQRAKKSQRPARIFYISDFDESGWGMPSGIARKIQYENDRDDLGLDVKLIPIVLTPEQIDQYKLPSAPDSNKVELDALEGLHPGELARIVEEAIQPYIDRKYEAQAREARSEFATEVGMARAAAVSEHEDDWRILESEYAELSASFDAQLSSISERRMELEEAMRARLSDVAEGISPMRFSVDPRTTESDDDLFDSTRDYFEQNEHYQKRRAEKARWFNNDKES